MKQKRWFCQQCGREWVAPFDGCDRDSAPFLFVPKGSIVEVEWLPEMGCPMPGCGWHGITLVEYTAEFRGGDIPRKNTNAVQMPPPVQPTIVQRFLGLFS